MKLPSNLFDVIFRRRLVNYDFFSGTTTWKDCASVVKSLAKTAVTSSKTASAHNDYARNGGEALRNGKYISKYEKLAASYHNVRFAFSFATGRMALYVILKALGIGHGDEVIIPAYTCIVVPNAILYCGAKPVYVDIDAKTFNIDTEKLGAAITPRTKAVLAQHTFGLPCDLAEIKQIAMRRGLFVVEDCALALGAEYNGRKVGSIGDVGFYSSDHTKMISTSTGGIIITNDAHIATKIKAIYDETPFLPRKTIRKILRAFVFENVLYHPAVCFVGKWLASLLTYLNIFHYFKDEGEIAMRRLHKHYPYPARLSNLQAKIGIRQLRGLEQNIVHRRRVAKVYDKVFGKQKIPSDRTHVYSRYSLRTNNKKHLIQKYSKYLQVGDWFNSPVHGRLKEFHKVFYQQGSCPNGELASKRCVNLPTHPKVSNLRLVKKLAEEIERSGLINPEKQRPRNSIRQKTKKYSKQ